MHGNLQPRPTSFIGRSDDMRALRTAVAGSARLVTLCGPPGVGKTRLATEAALAISGGAPPAGGIWFCDLNGATDLSALCARVGATLEPDASTGPQSDEVTRLGFVLAERSPLQRRSATAESISAVRMGISTSWDPTVRRLCRHETFTQRRSGAR